MSLPSRAARTGHKWTAAERAALSKKLRGQHRTPAQKKAESKRLTGKKHPHKGHVATAKELAALARGRAKAKAQHRPLTAKQKATLARGRAVSKAKAKAHKLSARQLAALAKARHRQHTAAERAAESARMKAKHHTPPRGLRLHHHPEAAHHGQSRPKRSGRVLASASRTRRIYPTKFGAVQHRAKSRYVKGRTTRTVHAPYAAGRHHTKSWNRRRRG